MAKEKHPFHQDEAQSELRRLEPYLSLFPRLWPELKKDQAIRQAQSWVSSDLYSAKELVAFAREELQSRQAAQNKIMADVLKEGLKGLNKG